MQKKNTTTGFMGWIEHWPIAVITGAIGLFAVGCKLVSGTEAPTSIERAFYTVQTNYVTEAKTVLNTNIVIETNEVQVLQTNTIGQVLVAMQTNLVPQYVVTPITNYVTEPVYTLTQNSNAATATNVVTTIGNSIMPGVGTLAGSGLTMLLGFWGWLRSYKTGSQSTQANGALVQEMETVLEFVNTLPNGSAYTAAITNWLQSHQVQTGTATTILHMIEGQVSNPDAKVAVQEILTTLQTLGTAVGTGGTTAASGAKA